MAIGTSQETIKRQMEQREAVERAFREALSVQNACNLSGVANSLSEHMSTFCGLRMGTQERNAHAVTRLFVAKMADLCGLDYIWPSEAESEVKRFLDLSNSVK